VRYLLIIIVLYVAYRLLRGFLLPRGPYHRGEDPPGGEGETMTKDPQCGTYFLKSQGVEARVGGETLYFCSEECREEYLKQQRRDE
jgi:YHS domain-containing protein